jgi:pyruvate/2-oxoglutarate dehydrogenase complex dihydrolipoamide dehydrogenase (E3) component
MLSEIGEGLETMTKKILLAKLKENGVTILTETKLLRIESAGAVVVCENDREMLIEADRVILATGTRPYDHLYQKAKSLGYEIHRIGDCLEARNAKEAIYEGAVLGRSL